MPVQTQNSSFAARLGARVAAANAEHRDKPVDLGNRRLPPNIKNGVAHLKSMIVRQETQDNKATPKGCDVFVATAVAMTPKELNGAKVEGTPFYFSVSLCDLPAKVRDGKEIAAVTFEANWYDFQNFFKLLGVAPPKEDPTTDPEGKRTEAYYLAAMNALTDPKRPVYISYSTRGWTPPKTTQRPNPAEMVFEEWHGLATPEQVATVGKHDPAASVCEAPPAPSDNGAHIPPAAPLAQAPVFDEFAPPPTHFPGAKVDPADEVASLVTTAMDDPDGATEEGRAATRRLEELAWANGWSREQTGGAENWEAVGDMALAKPPAMAAAVGAPPAVGSKWKFAKRATDGSKLKNSKGVEFPPADVEVVAVDAAGKTCTVKLAKDGKEVQDIRTKRPIAVKWEWLE